MCKQKFVVCPFVDEETNGSYPFANFFRIWDLALVLILDPDLALILDPDSDPDCL